MNNEPRVSVIMANWNGAAHIAAAVRSVLRQTERSLELIISDDGSDDDSLARARAAAAGDERMVVLPGGRRSGPAGARNRAIEIAKGRWIAIIDNDDYVAPDRLERLISGAERDVADITADDLIVFYEGGARRPHAHLRGALTERPHWISAAAYEHSNVLLGRGPALGYLKPVFRRSALGDLRYDERLRIAEDSDLVLRMLMSGARMRVYPTPGYFYRKHARSISHRLDADSIAALQNVYAERDAGGDLGLGLAFSEQRSALADARAFTEIVAALKARRPLAAARAALARPCAVLLFRDAIGARLLPRSAPRAVPGPRISLLSRQRIVGATNGSSAYVIGLARAFRAAGFAVDYIGATPKIFGRWAVMRLKPEIDTFDRYCVPGGLRLGRLVLSLDPSVWLASSLVALERIAAKLGSPARWSRPADYAQAARATRQDMLYVARRAAPGARAVLCDYAYLAPMAPFALSPEAPALVIMHDLISERVADPASEAATGKVAALERSEEMALLSLADAVIAIQSDEAHKVRTGLPAISVLTAPHGVEPSLAAQPGLDDTLLFVGSNTAPNIVGLQRFFTSVWPTLKTLRPHAELLVAGSVDRSLGDPPDGVRFLGVVDDLAQLYRDAGVVISPLYTGSGLKIKLIEAMAAGKAVVATSVTTQGVERLVGDAVVVADAAEEFVRAAADLMGDAAAREQLGLASLQCAKAHFSVDAAFSEVLAYVSREAPRSPRPAPLTAASMS